MTQHSGLRGMVKRLTAVHASEYSKYRPKDYPAEVGALLTTVSSIRVSRVRVTLTVTVRVSRVSVMVSVRDSVK